MKIFLTGGTGFIGSHVLDIALRKGFQVVATRRTTDSHPVIPLTRNPTWIERSLNAVTKDDIKNCDVLLHLASAGVSPKSVPFNEMVQVNVSDTLRLTDIARSAGINRLVIAGTCHEYGHAAVNYEAVPPDAPLEPANLYGASKAACFELLRCYCNVNNLELYYGRIFSAYGEGQFEGNFWPSLKFAAQNGLDFKMTSGSQIRDFMPVENVALSLIEACQRSDLQPGKPFVENIGSGTAISLLEFANQEWSRLGATGQILAGALPDRPGDVHRLVPLLSSNQSLV